MTLIILILILGLLIFVHELGHFIFAKLFKVHVYEFALGMGPKIFSFRRKNKEDETLYSLRLLPIGGFCSMAGEEAADDDELEPDKFMCNKTKTQRFIILVAGVTFNFILALLLLFTQSLIWGHTEQRPVIGDVKENSPAHKAGLEKGDLITKVNNHKVKTWDVFTIYTNLKQKDDTYKFEVKKTDGTKETYNLTKEVEKVDGEEIKVFGISMAQTSYKGFLNSVKYSFMKFGSTFTSMGVVIKSLITRKLGLSSLAGPVGMYSIVGETAKYGLNSIMYLTAYLSINLGFMNAIPFPAFDGGRLIFILIEGITKKKVSANIEGTLHNIGFILLMILMLYITVMDVLRLF